jgi:hypothetical protein
MYRLKIYTWTSTTAEARPGNDVFDGGVAVGVDQADGNTLLAEFDAGLPGCKCRSYNNGSQLRRSSQFPTPHSRRLNSSDSFRAAPACCTAWQWRTRVTRTTHG